MKVLGIDGGGSRTRAVVLGADGTLLGYAMGDSINIDDYGIETATQNLRELVKNLSLAGPLDAAFLSLGGVLSTRDRQAVRTICETLELAPLEQVGIHHDAVGALAGGLLGEPGMVVVTGTGSICYGRNAKGEEGRAGNWGPLFGDEGSGHWLGKEALRAVALAHDGRGEPTRLTGEVMQWLALTELDDLLHRLYVEGLSRSEIAAFAPIVLRLVEKGDAVARNVLIRGCDLLARCVETVHRHIFTESEAPTVIVGGLSQNETYLAAFREAVKNTGRPTSVVLPKLSPVMGSGLLALELLGVTVTSTVKATLVDSYARLPTTFY